jgi:hypothetical protein
MSERTYEGGCLCGSVRYRASGEAINPCYCHCRSCRGSCGAPSVAWATFRTERVELLRGAPTSRRSSRHVTRTFCGRCGTALTYANDKRPEQIDVTLASLDDAGELRPLAHIWFSHKLPWVEVADGLPQHAEWGAS